MSLAAAIVTSLLEKPGTGAELARRFDKSVGYFWEATHQQIYRELGRMEKAGLVTAREVPSSRGQRRHYEVMPAGRAALHEWCAGQNEPRAIRDELMLALRAAAVLESAATRGHVMAELRRHERLHRQTLADYKAIRARDFAHGPEGGHARALQGAVLSAGIAYEEAWLAWCAQTLLDIAH